MELILITHTPEKTFEEALKHVSDSISNIEKIETKVTFKAMFVYPKPGVDVVLWQKEFETLKDQGWLKEVLPLEKRPDFKAD